MKIIKLIYLSRFWGLKSLLLQWKGLEQSLEHGMSYMNEMGCFQRWPEQGLISHAFLQWELTTHSWRKRWSPWSLCLNMGFPHDLLGPIQWGRRKLCNFRLWKIIFRLHLLEHSFLELGHYAVRKLNGPWGGTNARKSRPQLTSPDELQMASDTNCQPCEWGHLGPPSFPRTSTNTIWSRNTTTNKPTQSWK